MAARGRVLDWTPPRPLLKFCAGLLLTPLPAGPDAVEIADVAAVPATGLGVPADPASGADLAPGASQRIATWRLSSPRGALPLVLTIRIRALPGAAALPSLPGAAALPDAAPLLDRAALGDPPAHGSAVPAWQARPPAPAERDQWWWYEVDVSQSAPARASAVLDSLASYLQIRAVRFVVLTPQAPEWRLLLPRTRA